MVTSSLSIASLLGTRPASTNVIILGGTVTRDELMVKGALASFVLGRFHFELAVVGAAAVSARWGVADLDMELAEINHQAVELADRTMVLANGAKIGSSAPALVVSLSSIEVLVTDLSTPEEELAAIRAQNVITRVVARPSPEGVAAAAHLPAPDGSRTARARQRA